jgi:hypothetical protein
LWVIVAVVLVVVVVVVVVVVIVTMVMTGVDVFLRAWMPRICRRFDCGWITMLPCFKPAPLREEYNDTDFTLDMSRVVSPGGGAGAADDAADALDVVMTPKATSSNPDAGQGGADHGPEASQPEHPQAGAGAASTPSRTPGPSRAVPGPPTPSSSGGEVHSHARHALESARRRKAMASARNHARRAVAATRLQRRVHAMDATVLQGFKVSPEHQRGATAVEYSDRHALLRGASSPPATSASPHHPLHGGVSVECDSEVLRLAGPAGAGAGPAAHDGQSNISARFNAMLLARQTQSKWQGDADAIALVKSVREAERFEALTGTSLGQAAGGTDSAGATVTLAAGAHGHLGRDTGGLARLPRSPTKAALLAAAEDVRRQQRLWREYGTGSGAPSQAQAATSSAAVPQQQRHDATPSATRSKPEAARRLQPSSAAALRRRGEEQEQLRERYAAARAAWRTGTDDGIDPATALTDG